MDIRSLLVTANVHSGGSSPAVIIVNANVQSSGTLKEDISIKSLFVRTDILAITES